MTTKIINNNINTSNSQYKQQSLVLGHLQCCNVCVRAIKLDNIQLNLTSCKHHICDDCQLSSLKNRCAYCNIPCEVIPVKCVPKHMQYLYAMPSKLFAKYNKIINFHSNCFESFRTKQPDLTWYEKKLCEIKAHNISLEKMCNKLNQKIVADEKHIGKYLEQRKNLSQKR